MFTRNKTNRIARYLGQQPEGRITRATESVTGSVPSGFYLVAAVVSMVASAFLQGKNRPNMSLFVGQWAPAILLIGLYNKIVKVSGSD